MQRSRLPLRLLLLAALAGCRTPDPKAELEVADVETYWAVDSPKGETQYIAPVVRFRLRNKSSRADPVDPGHRELPAGGRGGQNWGSAWEQVTQAGKPLDAGQQTLVVLRPDGRYTSTTDDPESMFAHELFKDARVEVFVRVGASNWARMTEAAIERKIGARGARELGAP